MAAVTTPIHLNQGERELLDEHLQGQSPRLLLRSATRVDTGRWWLRTRLWLCVLEDELLLFAASRRRYSQRVPLAECQASRYAHTAGALVIEPCERLRFKHLILPPTEALRVLDMIQQANDKTQTTPCTATENERA